MAKMVVKLSIFVLVILAIAIAVVPILVLIDLLDGGTGWGLCPQGLSACDRPFTTGPEVILILSVALFGTVMGIRILVKLSRRLEDDSYQVSQ